MNTIKIIAFLFLILFLPYPSIRSTRHTIPAEFHGVYPGGFSGAEDDFSIGDIISYERATGAKPDFVYFSHNWYKSREFPKEKVDMIIKYGAVPYIRLMLRSAQLNQAEKEDTFKTERIRNGELDEDFINWFKVARTYKSPLFVEYGIEVNGDWFNWNGKWNGGSEKGAENFREAYKRIIELSRKYGAKNLVWSFHPNDMDSPDEDWNRLEKYYPGDKYIDLFSISIYGMLTPADTQVKNLPAAFDNFYKRLQKLSADKPIVLIETGTTLNNPFQSQEKWAKDLFSILHKKEYTRLIGFSFWNEWWWNKDGTLTTMRVQDNPRLARIFRKNLKDHHLK